MATKIKTFDCVRMKRRIQESIVAEYEKSKAEFPLFSDFLKATESDWERQLRQKFAKPNRDQG